MAFWQYTLYMLPEEEVTSYFPNSNRIAKNSFDRIDWWKYRNLKLSEFDLFFGNIIPKTKSWSNEITQYGQTESNCIKLFTEDGIVKEINVRIDVRNFNEILLSQVILFSQKFKVSLIDIDFNILSLSKEALYIAIENYKNEIYRKF